MAIKINWKVKEKLEVKDWNAEVSRLEGELAYARLMKTVTCPSVSTQYIPSTGQWTWSTASYPTTPTLTSISTYKAHQAVTYVAPQTNLGTNQYFKT